MILRSSPALSFGRKVRIVVALLGLALISTASLRWWLTRSCFSFGTLKPGLYFNSDSHQFAPGDLQALGNLMPQPWYPRAAEAVFGFLDETLGIGAAERPLHFRFGCDLAQESGAQ